MAPATNRSSSSSSRHRHGRDVVLGGVGGGGGPEAEPEAEAAIAPSAVRVVVTPESSSRSRQDGSTSNNNNIADRRHYVPQQQHPSIVVTPKLQHKHGDSQSSPTDDDDDTNNIRHLHRHPYHHQDPTKGNMMTSTSTTSTTSTTMMMMMDTVPSFTTVDGNVHAPLPLPVPTFLLDPLSFFVVDAVVVDDGWGKVGRSLYSNKNTKKSSSRTTIGSGSSRIIKGSKTIFDLLQLSQYYNNPLCNNTYHSHYHYMSSIGVNNNNNNKKKKKKNHDDDAGTTAEKPAVNEEEGKKDDDHDDTNDGGLYKNNNIDDYDHDDDEEDTDDDTSLSTHIEAYINNNIYNYNYNCNYNYNYNPYRTTFGDEGGNGVGGDGHWNSSGEFDDLYQVRDAFLNFIVCQQGGQQQQQQQRSRRQGRGQSRRRAGHDACHAILQVLKVVARRVEQQQVELDRQEKTYWSNWSHNGIDMNLDMNMNMNMYVGGDRDGSGFLQQQFHPQQQPHHHHHLQQQHNQQYPPPVGPTGHGIIPTTLFPSSANNMPWPSASASAPAQYQLPQPPKGFVSYILEGSTGNSSHPSSSTTVASNGSGRGGMVMTTTAMDAMKVMNQQANKSYPPQPIVSYNSNFSSYHGHDNRQGHGYGINGGGSVAQGWVVDSYQYDGVQVYHQQQHQYQPYYQPYYQQQPRQKHHYPNPHPPHQYPSMPTPYATLSNGGSSGSIGNGNGNGNGRGPTMMFSPYYVMASNTFHEVRRLHRFFFALANEGLMILNNNRAKHSQSTITVNRHENEKIGKPIPAGGGDTRRGGAEEGSRRRGTASKYKYKYDPCRQGQTYTEKCTTIQTEQSKDTGRSSTDNDQSNDPSSPSLMPPPGQAPVQNPNEMMFLLSDGFKVAKIQNIDEIYERIGIIPVGDWKPRSIGKALGLKGTKDVRSLSHEIGQNILHALYRRRVFQTNNHFVRNITNLVDAGILSKYFLDDKTGSCNAKSRLDNHKVDSCLGPRLNERSHSDETKISFRHDQLFTETSIHWILIFFLDILSSESMAAKAAKWNLENKKVENMETKGKVFSPAPPFRPVYDDSRQHPFWRQDNGKPLKVSKKMGIDPKSSSFKRSLSTRGGVTNKASSNSPKKEDLIETGTMFGPTPTEAFRST